MNAYQIAERDAQEMLQELHQARIDAGLFARELARCAGIGARNLREYECGRKYPSLHRYVALANALGRNLAPAPVLVQNLRLRRSRAGITRKALSEYSRLDLTSLQAYEKGKYVPTLLNYVRWRNALDTLVTDV